MLEKCSVLKNSLGFHLISSMLESLMRLCMLTLFVFWVFFMFYAEFFLSLDCSGN